VGTHAGIPSTTGRPGGHLQCCGHRGRRALRGPPVHLRCHRVIRQKHAAGAVHCGGGEWRGTRPALCRGSRRRYGQCLASCHACTEVVTDSASQCIGISLVDVPSLPSTHVCSSCARTRTPAHAPAGTVAARGSGLVDALFASCPMNVGAKRLYFKTPAAKHAARAVFAAVLKHCPLFYGDVLATGVRVLFCLCSHPCMCACVHVCMCACVHVCMCACVHVCMCACVHVCMCACAFFSLDR
jgi:hypothetical protein